MFTDCVDLLGLEWEAMADDVELTFVVGLEGRWKAAASPAVAINLSPPF